MHSKNFSKSFGPNYLARNTMSRLFLSSEKGRLRLLIQCNYEENHLVKTLAHGTARWSRKDRAFSCPLEPIIIKRLMDSIPGIKVDAWVLEWYERYLARQRAAFAAVKDTKPLTSKPLVPFQMASVRFLSQAKRAILGHEMGTGKTPITCVSLDYVNAKKVLIICPNSVKWSWVDHLHYWSRSKTIYVLDSATAHDNPNLGTEVIFGSSGEREEIVTRLLVDSEEHVVIVNYTQLRMHSALFSSFSFDVVVADEAHRVKNIKAKQTVAFRAVTEQTSYVWMLTGTPVRNEYTDLYTLLAVCDPDRFGSYWDFVNTYFYSMPERWGGSEIIVSKPA